MGKAMRRTLRLSPRPFVVFALLLGPVEIWMLWSLAKMHFRTDMIIPSLLPIAVYAMILSFIASVRVTVDDDGIAVSQFYFLRSRFRWQEVAYSDVQLLAEKNHPWFMSIHPVDENERVVSLSLKPFRAEDVKWLCSIPELKARVFTGFTK